MNDQSCQISASGAPLSAAAVRAALAAAWPICLGFIPIGLSLGVLAQKSGLAAWQVGLMSLLVFAGGSQFIAVGLMTAGASLAAIVATTFMVNLRHLLMSSAMAVHLSGAGRRFLALFAYGVTDESFAVNMTRFRQGEWDRRQALILNQVTNATWIVSTVAGVFLGSFIPAGALGIDYALTGMFICLLVFQLRSPLFVLTAVIAAACSVFLAVTLPGNTGVIVASCLAATAGLVMKRWHRRRGGR
ncbi:MAG TPA: AzlC family ABC transporter permease [Geobacteraceae bacterium]